MLRRLATGTLIVIPIAIFIQMTIPIVISVQKTASAYFATSPRGSGLPGRYQGGSNR